MSILRSFAAAYLLLSGALISVAHASPPPPGLVHLRGTISAASPTSLSVLTTSGTVSVTLPPKTGVAGIIPADRANIKPGSFLGIASTPDSDGNQVAREVVIFPPSAAGTGEGSYGWDLPTQSGAHSRMTNGTVSASRMTNGAVGKSKMTNGTVNDASGNAVTLQYKTAGGEGSQKIALPANIPFVTFEPGTASLLKQGAHVFVVGKLLPSGSLVAVKVLVGVNGLVPPM